MAPGWNGTNLSTQYEYTDSNGTTHAAVVNGATGSFSPAYGDTSSGGQGPTGSTLDNVACETSMSDNYHIHVFVGLYVNGQEIALPTAVGMVNPQLDQYGDDMGNPSNGYYPCLYETHTHDSTGVVHIESFNGGVAETVPNDTKFVLGQIFSVWGNSVSWGGFQGSVGTFGPYTGPMEVFTSGQVFRGDGTQGAPTTAESDLSAWAGDPNQIPLYSHEVIWFLIGPDYPSSLPGVSFDEQF